VAVLRRFDELDIDDDTAMLLVSTSAATTSRPISARMICARDYVFGLGSGLEGDLVAERGELRDVAADLPFGRDASGVVAGAEVVESRGGIGE
jgi:hypothetical protein